MRFIQNGSVGSNVTIYQSKKNVALELHVTGAYKYSFVITLPPRLPALTTAMGGGPGLLTPCQFWRLTHGLGDWAWGGIYQVLTLHPDSDEITIQRWKAARPSPNRPFPILHSGHPSLCSARDFASRCTHRLLVLLTHGLFKGEIRAEFADTPNFSLTAPTVPPWIDSLRPLLPPVATWSVYTDASWKAVHPIPVQAVFGLQGTHYGGGALFLSADTTDWCSTILAARFDIPPTLRSLGGTAQVAELIAIHAGLHVLHTVYSDCLSAVKKVTRRWSLGSTFTDVGAALISSSRTYLSPRDTFRMAQRTPGALGNPPCGLVSPTMGDLHRGPPRQESGHLLAPLLAHPHDLPPGPPTDNAPPGGLAMGWTRVLPPTKKPSIDTQLPLGIGLSDEQGHAPRTSGGPSSLARLSPVDGDTVGKPRSTTSVQTGAQPPHALGFTLARRKSGRCRPLHGPSGECVSDL